MAMIDIAVINYNTKDLLNTCLTSIFAEQPSGKVIVVDNASADGSCAMVGEKYPSVILLENRENKGYGTAANQAFQLSTAKYLLLLNSDTRLLPGLIEVMINYLEQNPRVAIVGPRLLNPDSSIQVSTFPLPTPVDLFLDASNILRLVAKIPILREVNFRTWSHNRTKDIPWISGAAIAIRREAFDQVGGFDETFHMFYEETDLCYRLAMHGWSIHFNPRCQVFHVGGASTTQHRSQMSVQLYSSLAHFYRIHYSPLNMAELIILVKLIAFSRWVRDQIFLAFSRKEARRSVLSGNIQVWQNLISLHWERHGPSGQMG